MHNAGVSVLPGSEVQCMCHCNILAIYSQKRITRGPLVGSLSTGGKGEAGAGMTIVVLTLLQYTLQNSARVEYFV